MAKLEETPQTLDLPLPPNNMTKADLILWYENMGQILLAKAMQLRGSLDDDRHFLVVFGIRCAPIIRMVLDGGLRIDEVDWHDVKRRADEVLKPKDV